MHVGIEIVFVLLIIMILRTKKPKMKRLIFGMLTIGALFTSCSKDEDASCVAEDFVGTFTGTVNCPGDDVESATIIITKISSTEISIVDNDGFVILADLTDCQAKSTIIEDGNSFTVTFNLEGTSLSYVGVEIYNGDTYTCTGNFTK